eukprot:s2360_g15.t2
MKRFFAALLAALVAVRAFCGTVSDPEVLRDDTKESSMERNRTSGTEVAMDMNGRMCEMCGTPLPERSGSRSYVQRRDCGNQSIFEHPENFKKPLVQFTRFWANWRAANGSQPETNAWCELNAQKVCADTLHNKDALYQAKAIDIRLEAVAQKYDPVYCEQNGWLTDDYRALQHDFEAMKVKAEEFCSSRRAQWENMTLDDMVKVYYPSKARGLPTPEEGRLIGSWTCAMGSALCDMGYCAYTYCRKADGSFGIYDDCEGWDPVKGRLAAFSLGFSAQKTGSEIQRNQTSGVDVSIDVNGRLCSLCGMPLPERSDRSYVQRRDCGNQSLFEHPENKKKPLVQFTRFLPKLRAAKGNQPETSAWCELNSQKVCADTLYNKDVLYQAKSIDVRKEPAVHWRTFDSHYCDQNGWLSDDYRALQHDFEAMTLKAEEFCNSRHGTWDLNMTWEDVEKVDQRGRKRGAPTPEEGRLIGSWTCAMGSPLCDIGYCVYTYCRKADGSYGVYDDCKGWDPVTGSVVAFAKLQGLVGGNTAVPGGNVLSGSLAAACAAGLWAFLDPSLLGGLGVDGVSTLLAGTAAAAGLGLVVTSQVGGADMPVAITLLNSASGWALAAEGFVLSNNFFFRRRRRHNGTMFRRVTSRLRHPLRHAAAFARGAPRMAGAVVPATLAAAGIGAFLVPNGKVTQAQQVKRVAVYGGAFDPPTNSHMTCASEIVHSGCADEVWLVPCGPRPDKPKLKTPALDRYCMCQVAVNTVFSPEFPIRVSDIDTRREMAAFTYDLLCSLRDAHPGVQFTFVIGSDWLQPGTSIADWTSLNHNWKPGMPESQKYIVTGDKLLREFEFLVIPRPGYDGNLSSTEIRTRTRVEACKGGNLQTIEGLIPPGVLSYIRRQELYYKLTIVGALIGSSGAILSQIMCDAMNRNILEVLGIIGKKQKKGSSNYQIEGEVTTTNKEHVADLLAVAKKAPNLIRDEFGLFYDIHTLSQCQCGKQ